MKRLHNFSRLLAAAFLVTLIAQAASYGRSHGQRGKPGRSQYGTSIIRLPLIYADEEHPGVSKPFGLVSDYWPDLSDFLQTGQGADNRQHPGVSQPFPDYLQRPTLCAVSSPSIRGRGICAPEQTCRSARIAARGYRAHRHARCRNRHPAMVCCIKGNRVSAANPLQAITFPDTAPSSSAIAPPPPTPSRQEVVDFSAPNVDFECGFGEGYFDCNKETKRYNHDGTIKELYCAAGGNPAEVNKWPWAALLGWRAAGGAVQWSCSGSLINSRWIVTAAHCLTQSLPQLVRLGEHDYTNATDGATPKDFRVRRAVFHPRYSFGVGYHDIALLELDRTVELHPKSITRPICLPWGKARTAKMEGRNVVLTGWGSTQFGGELSPVLQVVVLEVFNAARCDRSYQNLPRYGQDFPNGIRNSDFVCAGDREGGKDACPGDSGGPISYNSIDHGFVLAGVVSKGYGCGLADYPGLYTPLHREDYLSWIKATAFT